MLVQTNLALQRWVPRIDVANQLRVAVLFVTQLFLNIQRLHVHHHSKPWNRQMEERLHAVHPSAPWHGLHHPNAVVMPVNVEPVLRVFARRGFTETAQALNGAKPIDLVGLWREFANLLRRPITH